MISSAGRRMYESLPICWMRGLLLLVPTIPSLSSVINGTHWLIEGQRQDFLTLSRFGTVPVRPPVTSWTPCLLHASYLSVCHFIRTTKCFAEFIYVYYMYVDSPPPFSSNNFFSSWYHATVVWAMCIALWKKWLWVKLHTWCVFNSNLQIWMCIYYNQENWELKFVHTYTNSKNSLIRHHFIRQTLVSATISQYQYYVHIPMDIQLIHQTH